MVKLVFVLHRRAELSREEFQRYWRENHAPLVKRHAETLGIRRYVQVHTVDHAINATLAEPRAAPEPYDGVAELWFDSLEAMTAEPSEAAQLAALELIEDERRFIDLERSPLWMGEEHPVVG